MNENLTGLADRKHFFKLLGREVRRSNEFSSPIALLVVDLQRFNRINSLYGYAAGDQVLDTVAAILLKVARQQDSVARIGDDQFAVLLSGISNPEHARLAAFKIERLLDLPLPAGDDQIRCSVRIGIAVCPLHSSGAEDLLKTAEEALMAAKMSGQSIGMAQEETHEFISETWDIEIELVDAIKKHQMEVYFQPKVSLQSGKPVGAEALIRWNSPSRGLVGPDLFIPVAESLGILKQITLWMLNSALRLSGDWSDQWGRLEVSINIPAGLLIQPDFIDIVRSVKGLWQPHNITLCLEVLEKSFISDVESCFEALKRLREMGVKIAIDDFGTGYSSLSYFRDIPADELKIDQSFVFGLLSDRANAHIVSLIIDLAHSFNLTVVAEGVENRETLEAIKTLGCDVVQGYLYSKPIPVDQFKQWLVAFK
ncbi:MAG: bifunctional diguanylate cyclase/phosphodiesterase [Sedimenticola sp.]